MQVILADVGAARLELLALYDGLLLVVRVVDRVTNDLAYLAFSASISC